ncbi:ATP-dependent DNA helicase RecG [Bathymodiolus septemdierum thioautotrophic gill symbiont]|uniref:ATP-dependent DNA helicase RecG n=1 Tax=endosymbiont of Bathymodiolus septemdierum str. Myojin knoll TaxID=1303921 RepID=A0A0P0UR44_9GAMM|nr:ATP-dependent DNA helicase RecG [Bathymodiolus septemdierum thioautotrophic gill symbiont]BAS67235.1 ATP-dependent DNA helicase RecG [endosymbiont of Bathymodiolus septemdierum str. Myojin knoll]
MSKLSDPVISIHGLGPKARDNLNGIGIYNLEHLLFHLPFRYQNKTHFTKLNEAHVGNEILVQLTIDDVQVTPLRTRQMVCHLSDENGWRLLLRFFHFNQWQREQLTREDIIQCFGEVKIGKDGLEMHHPEYRLISKGQSTLLEKTLSPIYPLTGGIHQAQMKKWVGMAMEALQNSPLVDNFKGISHSMPSLKQALAILHHPKEGENLTEIAEFRHTAQQRLIIEELCVQQLSLLRLKEERKHKIANVFAIKECLFRQLHQNLGFTLTNAQQRCIADINTDLSSNHPMLRLLQGDVGSGKTIVAVFACLQAVENGFQTAIMAPTEILAHQHFQGFSDYLNPLRIEVAFLTGSQNTTTRKEQLEKIQSGQAQVVIGTHALFQESVEFKKLGLVVIDEQHKFGVHQRLSLAQKAYNTPHQLVMTATPIPRSLTMSAYADLDSSIIDELPPGRTLVQTVALNNERKDEIIGKIEQVCKAGNQVYWVCTLIDETEVLRAESATNTHAYLQENLPNLSVVLIHGRMNKDEKTEIMQQFEQGEINVLVATTVIEVGVNVPNASLMVIENSERLGLAQLHQLRGRVGRGNDKSICILMYQAPLSSNAKQRLGILRETNDGFKIAEKDLQLRGPGEILGTQQTGVADMKIANVVRDGYLIEKARFYCEQFMQEDETKQQALIARWITDDKSQYANT